MVLASGWVSDWIMRKALLPEQPWDFEGGFMAIPGECTKKGKRRFGQK